jgi:hypothetical protein
MSQKNKTHSHLHYPAHPGRRTPSPELKRESGDGILRAGSSRKSDDDGAEIEAERDASTSARGSKTVVADDEIGSTADELDASSSPQLCEQFKGDEVQEWASRMHEKDA